MWFVGQIKDPVTVFPAQTFCQMNNFDEHVHKFNIFIYIHIVFLIVKFDKHHK